MPQLPDFTRTDSLLRLGDHPMYKRTGRGVTQTLEMIEAGEIADALDGHSVFLGMDDYPQKFTSTISCDDWFPPQLDQLRRAQIIRVECVNVLGRTGLALPGEFQRRHVPGSIVHMDNRSIALPGDGEGGYIGPNGEVHGPAQVAWTKYRPMIDFRVVSWSITTDEWGAKTSWTLNLREHYPLLPQD